MHPAFLFCTFRRLEIEHNHQTGMDEHQLFVKNYLEREKYIYVNIYIYTLYDLVFQRNPVWVS